MFQLIEKKETKRKKGRENVVITVGGMIGAGKSTITSMLAKELNYKPLYESVDDNQILPLFYTASPEEQAAKRYPFLLQLEFLDSRYSVIKQALLGKETVVMDRSIYEDWYFAKVNTEIGNISEQEFHIYEKLLNNMMEELNELPKKSPDLMVYLKISFEKTMERIGKRGREFEQDESLYNYYYKLWAGYDNWIMNHYDHSRVLIIDMDQIDVEENPEQISLIIEQIELAAARELCLERHN